MFRGPCIVTIFRHISNKTQRYTVYLFVCVVSCAGGTQAEGV